MDISKAIKELNSKIKEKYSDFRGSYLFGSRARGDYREDSDVDIVLIFDKEPDYDTENYIYEVSGELDYKYNIVTIPLPYTIKELQRNCVFHDEVVNKGIFYNAA